METAIINTGESTEYKKYRHFMVLNVRRVLLTIRKCVREIVREKTDAIPVRNDRLLLFMIDKAPYACYPFLR